MHMHHHMYVQRHRYNVRDDISGAGEEGAQGLQRQHSLELKNCGSLLVLI